MQIGYARVSTKEQGFALQLDALRKAGCEQVYQEVASGAKTERPVLAGLLRELRPGDVLVIWKLDRLGRSLRHLVELAATLMEQPGCRVSARDTCRGLLLPTGLAQWRQLILCRGRPAVAAALHTAERHSAHK